MDKLCSVVPIEAKHLALTVLDYCFSLWPMTANEKIMATPHSAGMPGSSCKYYSAQQFLSCSQQSSMLHLVQESETPVQRINGLSYLSLQSRVRLCGVRRRLDFKTL